MLPSILDVPSISVLKRVPHGLCTRRPFGRLLGRRRRWWGPVGAEEMRWWRGRAVREVRVVVVSGTAGAREQVVRTWRETCEGEEEEGRPQAEGYQAEETLPPGQVHWDGTRLGCATAQTDQRQGCAGDGGGEGASK